MLKDESYILDAKANKIWKKTLVSKKKVKLLTEKEAEQIFFTEQTPLCILWEENALQWYEFEQAKIIWQEQVKNHIMLEDDDSTLDDFENGYSFFAELWSMKYGKKLIVLYYGH